MKYAAEMASGSMIYIASFIMSASGVQKLLRAIPPQVHTQQSNLISLL
jgi:hypothetical protein